MSSVVDSTPRPGIHAATVVLCVAIVYGFFLVASLQASGWDASQFVCASAAYCDPARVPPGLAVHPGTDGYDGQFYYRLSLTPWTAAREASGIQLDVPAYRQQRILYPVLVWVASLGRPAWVPVTLIAVNYASLLVVAAFATLLAQTLQRHAYWGLLLALQPAFLPALRRDTPEILAAAALLIGLWALQRHRWRTTIVALSCAVLAKETAVGVVLVLLAYGTIARLRRRSVPNPLTIGLCPLVVYAFWQATLRFRWGAWPLAEGRGNLGMPGAALGALLRDAWLQHTPESVALRVFLAYFGVCAILTAIACLRSRAAPPIRTMWFAYTALALCLSQMVWCDPWAFLRAMSEWCLLGAVLLLGRGGWPLVTAALATGALWLPLARVAAPG